MFQFALPKHARIAVQSPTGGTQFMLHLGDGVFASELPPLMFHGQVPAGDAVPLRGLPVSWNSDPHAGRAIEEQVFVFDAPGAMEAVKAAAEAGDAPAQAMLDRLEQGARMMSARESLKIVAASLVPSSSTPQ